MTSRRTRLTPKARREQILDAALGEARTRGYENVRRHHVAECAGVSPGLVGHYFSTMPQLQRAIMREAVARGDVAIVAQGLARRDKQAIKAPAALREAAGAFVGGRE